MKQKQQQKQRRIATGLHPTTWIYELDRFIKATEGRFQMPGSFFCLLFSA